MTHRVSFFETWIVFPKAVTALVVCPEETPHCAHLWRHRYEEFTLPRHKESVMKENSVQSKIQKYCWIFGTWYQFSKVYKAIRIDFVSRTRCQQSTEEQVSKLSSTSVNTMFTKNLISLNLFQFRRFENHSWTQKCSEQPDAFSKRGAARREWISLAHGMKKGVFHILYWYHVMVELTFGCWKNSKSYTVSSKILIPNRNVQVLQFVMTRPKFRNDVFLETLSQM